MSGMNLCAIKAALAAGMGRAGEAGDQVGDFSVGKGNRLTELSAGQAQLDRRWCLGMRVDRLHRLPPGMADLCPELGSVRLGRASPAAQRVDHGAACRPIEDDIAGTLKVIAIDLYVPRQQQTATTRAPDAVKLLKFGCRLPQRIGQPLRHRRLGQAVRQYSPAGQG